ncbi:hypothetical protein V6C16_13385, partial [Desulfovibrio sp. 1188_IL3213]
SCRPLPLPGRKASGEWLQARQPPPEARFFCLLPLLLPWFCSGLSCYFFSFYPYSGIGAFKSAAMSVCYSFGLFFSILFIGAKNSRPLIAGAAVTAGLSRPAFRTGIFRTVCWLRRPSFFDEHARGFRSCGKPAAAGTFAYHTGITLGKQRRALRGSRERLAFSSKL